MIFINYLKKYSLITLGVLYFLARLINLVKLPIFNDEAIYLNWGWKSLHGAGLFHSLYDGRLPFLIWVFGILESLIESSLFLGRFISVIAGFLILLGIYFNFLDRYMPSSQKSAYVTDRASGYGIPETIKFLKNVLKIKR